MNLNQRGNYYVGGKASILSRGRLGIYALLWDVPLLVPLRAYVHGAPEYSYLEAKLSLAQSELCSRIYMFSSIHVG